MQALKKWRWHRKICCFYETPKLVPLPIRSCRKRLVKFLHLTLIFSFRNTFFPSSAIEWNNLDTAITYSEKIGTFKKRVLAFTRPPPNFTLNFHKPKSLKLLTRLHVGLCHPCKYKFKHRFHDSVNTCFSCGNDSIKTSSCFLLRCYNFSDERLTLWSSIRNIGGTVFQQNDAKVNHVSLLSNASFNKISSKFFFFQEVTTDYLVITRKFDEALFNNSLAK